MHQVHKDAKQIEVMCTEREEGVYQGEDPAGDLAFTPAVLTFHLSTTNAVGETLETLRDNQQESVSMAAARVNM